MRAVIGGRVGAIDSIEGGNVEFFGYGVYVGDEPVLIPGEGQGFNLTNPKIVLDNGKVVWGMECWWGPEQEIKELLVGRTVTLVDIDEVRART